MSSSGGSRTLVARGVDGWLVGGLAVAVWCVAFAATRYGVALPANLISGVYWTGAVISAAHFGLSYHLAYRGGSVAMRARPTALLIAPVLLVVALAAIVVVSLESGTASVGRVTAAMITFVYLTTTWHYVKQVYGVGRIGAAYSGISLDAWDVRVLRYGLYPLWFLGAAQLLVRDKVYSLAGYRIGYGLLPSSAWQALQIAALCFALPVAAVFLRLRVRSGSWPSALLVAPYAAAFLWIGMSPGVVITTLLLAPFHALQYLAVAHRAELSIARPGQRGLGWWLNIFAGAACGGLLLGRWVPQWLDAHVHPAGNGPLLFAAAFFVFLNLHHYLIDASIWRSKGELVKAMVRKPITVPAPEGELVRS